MGGGQSKEEQLYQAVQNANHTAVKTLRRDGTSLEWTDKDGRTPLILACTRGELFDMAITLLNLGASIKAFRPGSHGGYPLHHAAKRGLDKTVILLLSRGADPLAVNDDGQTPLDMARNRGHVSVVRIIEDRICLFSGVLREISGPGFLEALAPQWVTRKIWAVVLPSAQSRRLPRQEVVIYQSPKVSLPRIIIPLSKAQIEEPNFNLPDPVMILTDKSSKTRFKFLSEFEGRRPQLEKFYKACKGIPVTQVSSNGSSPQASLSPSRTRALPITIATPAPPPPPVAAPPQQIHPQVVVSSPPRQRKHIAPPTPPRHSAEIPEDVALAMAITASIQSASAEGLVIPPTVGDEWPSLSSPPRPPSRRRGPLGRNSRCLDSSTSDLSSSNNSSNWGSPEAGPSSAVYDRARVENIWETRPIKNLNPVRNVLVKDPSAPTAPPAPVPVQVFVPPGLSSPPACSAPASRPTSSTETLKNSARPSRPASTSGSSKSSSSSSNSSSESLKTSGFSLFGIKKKALSSEEKAPEEKASGQCVVCWDAPARAVCIPCGHLAGCMNCLMEIKEKTWGCPVCRTSIQQVIKVFTV